MSNKNWLFFVNMGIAVLLGAVFIMGMMLTTVIPSGHGQMASAVAAHGAGHAPSFLGLQREAWADFHKMMGILFVLGVAAHLYLNWRWVRQVANERFGASANRFLYSLPAASVALVVVGYIVMIITN